MVTQEQIDKCIQVAKRFGAKRLALSGKTGDLYITSQPQGAAVEIDGKPVTGATPVALKGFAAGEHRIAARKEDYHGSQAVMIAPDDLVKVNLTLHRGKGLLKLFTTPDAADVMLDGKNVGSAPHKLDNEAAGEHSLRVSKSGYLAEEGAVRITNNQRSSLNVTVKPAGWVSLKCSQGKARILLNGTEVGSGEIGNHRVLAGEVLVQAELPGNEPFGTAINLAQGEDKEIEATLVSVFGTLALGLWGGGIRTNSVAQNHVDNQKRLQAIYRKAADAFDSYQAPYDAEGQSAADDRRNRNAWYALGGAFTIGCLISTPS